MPARLAGVVRRSVPGSALISPPDPLSRLLTESWPEFTPINACVVPKATTGKLTVLLPLVERMEPAVSVKVLPCSPVPAALMPPLILKALIVAGAVKFGASVMSSVAVGAARLMSLLVL